MGANLETAFVTKQNLIGGEYRRTLGESGRLRELESKISGKLKEVNSKITQLSSRISGEAKSSHTSPQLRFSSVLARSKRRAELLQSAKKQTSVLLNTRGKISEVANKLSSLKKREELIGEKVMVMKLQKAMRRERREEEELAGIQAGKSSNPVHIEKHEAPLVEERDRVANFEALPLQPMTESTQPPVVTEMPDQLPDRIVGNSGVGSGAGSESVNSGGATFQSQGGNDPSDDSRKWRFSGALSVESWDGSFDRGIKLSYSSGGVSYQIDLERCGGGEIRVLVRTESKSNLSGTQLEIVKLLEAKGVKVSDVRIESYVRS